LYRGGGVFSRQDQKAEIIKSVTDNFVDFGDGIRSKQMYAVKTEAAVPITRYLQFGTNEEVFLSLSSQIVRSALNIPPINTEPSVDPEPDYAVYSVRHIRQQMRIVGQKISPSVSGTVIPGTNIPVATTWQNQFGNPSIGVPILLNGQPIDIVGTGPDAPVLKMFISSGSAAAFEYTFRPGVDYRLIHFNDDPGNYFAVNFQWTTNSIPSHWRIVPIEATTITIPSGSNLTGQYGGTGEFLLTGSSLPPAGIGAITTSGVQELDITYSLDPDITRRVKSIDYDANEIAIGPLQLTEGDTVEVRYRSAPTQIIRDSVRVTSNFGTDNEGVVYSEGRDFSLNVNNGTITKINGGRIGDIGADVAYVDFQYRDTVDQTVSFSAWVYVSSRDPIKFDYNSLNLKRTQGESFIWTYVDASGDATQDLSVMTSFTMTRGWHFFVIKSLPPGKFSDAAIIKILKLRSVLGDYLFLTKNRGGKIIDRITAYRSPMRQVTFPFLKNSVLKSNHTVFSLDDNNLIYVNFPPGGTNELYMKQVNSAGVIIEKLEEDFRFQGTRRLVTDKLTTDDAIVLHALLTRSDTSDGGVTPKLFSYNIRVSY